MCSHYGSIHDQSQEHIDGDGEQELCLPVRLIVSRTPQCQRRPPKPRPPADTVSKSTLTFLRMILVKWVLGSEIDFDCII